jgi:DNA polymerase I-like protein with 3'-5' exonuclease and polymerase domains/uracil-DNA glycosylase
MKPLCHLCPLGPHCITDHSPISPENAFKGAKIAVVLDEPSGRDMKEGRPATDAGGALLTQTLSRLGVQRRDVHWTAATLCPAQEKTWDPLLSQIKRQNASIRRSNAKATKAWTLARKQAQKDGEPDPPPPILEPLKLTPQQACAPRLAHELEGVPHIIPAGKYALKSLIGSGASIAAQRGALIEGQLVWDEKAHSMKMEPTQVATQKIVPTWSPSFVYQQREWMKSFKADLTRAVRWFKNDLPALTPNIILQPSPSELRAFLATDKPLAWDTETDSIDARNANLRCIGIGTSDTVMVCGFMSKEAPGLKQFYSETEAVQIRAIISEWLTRPTAPKIGQNSGYYDHIVMRYCWGIEVAPHMDTQLLHRLAEGEVPHNLAYIASVYSPFYEAWKYDRQGRKRSTDAESDHDLHVYCGQDVAYTYQVSFALLADVQTRKQQHLIPIDHATQSICVEMGCAGLYVDQKERARQEDETLKAILRVRDKLRSISGIPDLNPGSTFQLKNLIYREWNLDPNCDWRIKYTKTGDLSLNDKVIRAFLSDDNLTKQHRMFFLLLRVDRKLNKRLGTYIVKLRPENSTVDAPDGIGWDADMTDEDGQPIDYAQFTEEEQKAYEWRLSRKFSGRGIVQADGRMYPGYNAGRVITARLSSSAPMNAQNFDSMSKWMVIPAPGRIYISVDADQLEMRIASSYWKLKRYLEAFDNGWDPHSSVTALSVFGDAFVKAAMACGAGPFPWLSGTSFDGDAKQMRNTSKIIYYAGQYGASVKTQHQVFLGTENKKGQLTHLKTKLSDVRSFSRNWLKNNPGIQRGWEAERNFYRGHGYVEEPVTLRRRYIPQEDPNKIYNFYNQGSAAAMMNRAMRKIIKEIPPNKWGYATGLVTHTHDSFLIEAPLDGCTWEKDEEGNRYLKVRPGSAPEFAFNVLNDALNFDEPKLPGIKFMGAPQYAPTWAESA